VLGRLVVLLPEDAGLTGLALPKALNDPPGATVHMVEFAVDADGADNITVVLIPIPHPETPDGSVLGPDKLIQPRHSLPAGHRYGGRPGKPPGYPELVQCLPAQPENVLGLVVKKIAGVLIPSITSFESSSYPVDAAPAIGMEQPSGELPGYFSTIVNCHCFSVISRV
jgi:hypothetical protein